MNGHANDDDVMTFRSGEYPHIFNNVEGLDISDCRSDTLLEYPLITTGVYKPGRDQPEADRVVYAVIKTPPVAKYVQQAFCLSASDMGPV